MEVYRDADKAGAGRDGADDGFDLSLVEIVYGHIGHDPGVTGSRHVGHDLRVHARPAYRVVGGLHPVDAHPHEVRLGLQRVGAVAGDRHAEVANGPRQADDIIDAALAVTPGEGFAALQVEYPASLAVECSQPVFHAGEGVVPQAGVGDDAVAALEVADVSDGDARDKGQRPAKDGRNADPRVAEEL